MSDYEFITLEYRKSLAILTLNQPERLNAINAQMLQELHSVLSDLGGKYTKARALIITGAGRGFCSGADLNSNTMAKMDAGGLLIKNYHPVLLELESLDIPVITAINGIAAGAGMGIALSSDYIIAAQSASFIQAFINIGLVPDAGSSYYLPRLVGPARAKQLMMLGEQLSAAQAYDWGMINELVEDEHLMEAALAIGEKFASGPTKAYAGIRAMMRTTYNNSYAQQIQTEAMEQRKASRSSDATEGIQAFLQKRPADFKGA